MAVLRVTASELKLRDKAHQALDRAVDRLYRTKPVGSDKQRLELLFERYRALVEQAR